MRRSAIAADVVRFELRWSQGETSGPELAVTGPAGTKDFMAAEMPELPRAD